MPTFRKNIDGLLQSKRQSAETPAWFQKMHPESPLKCVAYFSMEYMLSEALPIYSGGLGNVAGDQLKAASDLGVPVVGVGLLYQQGYFRQVIDQDGAQQALYPITTPGNCRSPRCASQTGSGCAWKSRCRDTRLAARVAGAGGRVKLYLLDSNDAPIPGAPRNHERVIGGGPELRLKQEMLLASRLGVCSPRSASSRMSAT